MYRGRSGGFSREGGGAVTLPKGDQPPRRDAQPAAGAPGKPILSLRGLTPARIGLERSGASLATRPLLDFSLAHARARDAVHEALDDARLAAAAGALAPPVLVLGSAARDRRTYLLRPDLGHRLGEGAPALLAPHAGDHDLVVVVADGLSARAVQSHAVPVLAAALPALRDEGWRIAPLVIVHQGRVAIGDAVAAELGAQAVAVLIGERPGLSSPDSMGIYLTWRPGPQTTDADRNCISNIRPAGIPYAEAAFKMAFLLREMRARGFSGVRLKDESEARLAVAPGAPPGELAQPGSED
jgi:ethanolamine ammonia-lyase small subunit